MNKEPLLSVVVPVYNVEPYLERCIQSILNQTYKNLEVILVDDGSTDKSGSVCDEYVLQDDRVKVIHKKNGGLVSARKAGAAIATGSYITAVDSDDWIESNMFEEMMKQKQDESAENDDQKINLIDMAQKSFNNSNK